MSPYRDPKNWAVFLLAITVPMLFVLECIVLAVLLVRR